MSTDIDVLGDAQADFQAYKRQKILNNLAGSHSHLTLAQLAKFVTHADHGEAAGAITLQELYDAVLASQSVQDVIADREEEEAKAVAAAKPKKPKKPTAKKAAAVKKKAKKDAAVVGKQKADAGKTKPRLDREQGYKEILKALRTAGGPCGRKALEDATGYPGVQVRTFCKELAAQKPPKIVVLGKGGRGTQYDLASRHPS